MVCRQLERYLANNNLRRRSKSGCYLPNSRLPQFSYFLCNAGSANGSICFCRNQRLGFSLSKLPLHLTVIVELFMWIDRTQFHSRAFPAHCQVCIMLLLRFLSNKYSPDNELMEKPCHELTYYWALSFSAIALLEPLLGSFL